MRDEEHLARRPANFQPLTPLEGLVRTLAVYPERTAVIWNDERLTWRQFGDLVGRFAAVLRRAGIGPGDVVAVIAANRPEMLAAHFAVPMLGAVLAAVNTRLDAEAVAYILDHAGAKAIVADPASAPTARTALATVARGRARLLVLPGGEACSPAEDFAAALAKEEPLPIGTEAILDEWQPICINYTSGTTGRPKGAVYHHRGAWLNALGNVMALRFDASTVYLWTLPMFHCNGWCHTWAVTAAGGTHVCLDRVDPALIVAALEERGVTHFCCAPVVLYMLLNHDRRPQPPQGRRIVIGTGGAAPTSALIEALDAMGMDLIHLYGLTESFGPASLCALRDDWDVPDSAAKARALARQGVRHMTASRLSVVDAAGQEVPADGATLGEIVLHGNTLMAGYYGDAATTDAAFTGGVFHTGDLAVRHEDGYVEIRDRSKDIIISGGENISSLEVESVLHQHPSVLLAAVVAAPDPKWGEVPCAFIELRAGVPRPAVAELTAFCRERLAGFKIPRRFVFRDLPRTATGKIQKYALRADLQADLQAELRSDP
jgi:fatty-acyl-CoA synthase